jgi:hypothetical protein
MLYACYGVAKIGTSRSWEREFARIVGLLMGFLINVTCSRIAELLTAGLMDRLGELDWRDEVEWLGMKCGFGREGGAWRDGEGGRIKLRGSRTKRR